MERCTGIETWASIEAIYESTKEILLRMANKYVEPQNMREHTLCVCDQQNIMTNKGEK